MGIEKEFETLQVNWHMHFVVFNFLFSSHFFVGNSFNGINAVVPAIDGAGTTGLISLKLFPTKEWEDKKKLIPFK